MMPGNSHTETPGRTKCLNIEDKGSGKKTNMAAAAYRRTSTAMETPLASPVTTRDATPKSGPRRVNSEHGVIVNELLCYVCNKMDILPQDTIVKLCSDVFKDHEVEEAKAILYDSCAPDNGRRIKRKGAEKKKNNMHDMLNLLHATDPDVVPCFVACDLSKLPSVHYNHIDMSVLLKELDQVKGDIAELKLVQTATLQISKENTAKPGNMTSIDRTVEISAQRDGQGDEQMVDKASTVSDSPDGGRALLGEADESSQRDCGLDILNESGANSATAVWASDDSDREEGELDDSITEVKQLIASSSRSAVTQSRSNSAAGGTTLRATAPSFAGVAAHLASQGMKPRQECSLESADDGFTTVPPRRKKPVVIGTAQSSALRGVKSAPPTSAVFVTRLAPGTTHYDI